MPADVGKLFAKNKKPVTEQCEHMLGKAWAVVQNAQVDASKKASLMGKCAVRAVLLLLGKTSYSRSDYAFLGKNPTLRFITVFQEKLPTLRVMKGQRKQ